MQSRSDLRTTVFTLAAACSLAFVAVPRDAAAASLFQRLGNRIQRAERDTGKRVSAFLHPHPQKEGLVARYMLRDIVRNAGKIAKSGDGVTREEQQQAKEIVKSARATLSRSQKDLTPEHHGVGSAVRGAMAKVGRKLEGRPATSSVARETYDANFQSTLPGTLELSETDQDSKVPAAHRMFDAMKTFVDLNKALGFDVKKIATNGALSGTEQYGHLENAYWDGTRMVTGGGSPTGLFKPLDLGPDVIYHEMGHGMTEKVLTKDGLHMVAQKQGFFSKGMAGLVMGRAFRNLRSRITGAAGILEYQGQSGALNESISDIYGAMGNQFAAKKPIAKTTEKDWLIGYGILNDGIQNPGHDFVALRNMLHPGTAYNDPRLGKDRQPDNMKDLYTGANDNGGVHINSGIPNRAFAVSSMDYAKAHPDATAWDTTGKVWLHAMSLVGPNATFQEAANAIFKTAKDMYPKDASMAQAIKSGWSQVGVNVQ